LETKKPVARTTLHSASLNVKKPPTNANDSSPPTMIPKNRTPLTNTPRVIKTCKT
ncbi:hypothetical protein HDU76_011427, partial [Blyttiomyces sp. JEL0837]